MKIFKDYLHINHRAEFANYVCKLLVEKHNGNIDAAANNCKEAYDHFEENVRNVYELISDEIPLFRLYEMTQKSHIQDFMPEDYNGLTIEQYVAQIKKECTFYYYPPSIHTT